MNRQDFTLSHESFSRDYDLLLLALQASKSGIIITDNRQLDNPITFANQAFEEMSGYKHNEIIGRNCRFLQGTDREQEGRYVLGDAVRKGEGCIVELRNYKKNGTRFWNELYMAPVKDKDGSVTHFIGVQNDITRRKNAESTLLAERELLERNVRERTRHLKESEDYLRTIIETLREALLVLDKDMTVLSANAFFYATFALTPEQVIGKSLYEAGNGEWNLPELKNILEVVLPANNPFEGFEMTNDFKERGRKDLILNARRIEVDGNYKDRILLALQDVTENKANETRKDDFLSIASHELRTPLTTVQGYMQLAELLLQEDDKQTAIETLNKGYEYVSKLNNLISDLLDVSRIQAKHMQLNKTEFEFDDMIRSCVETVQVGIKTHQIQVDGKVGTLFTGDKERLEQVMVNLLQNAAKYSPGSDLVKVIVTTISGFIKVSVTDTGVGIGKEDQKKVFERFYRVQETQKDFAGIGIGLYVCDTIIREHQGTLWVDSEIGKGSTFSFTLPFTSKQ